MTTMTWLTSTASPSATPAGRSGRGTASASARGWSPSAGTGGGERAVQLIRLAARIRRSERAGERASAAEAPLPVRVAPTLERPARRDELAGRRSSLNGQVSSLRAGELHLEDVDEAAGGDHLRSHGSASVGQRGRAGPCSDRNRDSGRGPKLPDDRLLRPAAILWFSR